MWKDIKASLVFFSVIILSLFLYWISGNDFNRSIALAETISIGIVFGGMASTMFYDKDK